VLEVVAGGRTLALPLEDVRGVARAVPLVPIPGAPAAVAGLANIRGTLVTVLDLERIGADGVTAAPVTLVAPSVVLLAGWEGRVGLAVERWGQVLPRAATPDVVAVAPLVGPWLEETTEDAEGGR
jgi:chemotaxis signal transduction protein